MPRTLTEDDIFYINGGLEHIMSSEDAYYNSIVKSFNHSMKADDQFEKNETVGKILRALYSYKNGKYNKDYESKLEALDVTMAQVYTYLENINKADEFEQIDINGKLTLGTLIKYEEPEETEAEQDKIIDLDADEFDENKEEQLENVEKVKEDIDVIEEKKEESKALEVKPEKEITFTNESLINNEIDINAKPGNAILFSAESLRLLEQTQNVAAFIKGAGPVGNDVNAYYTETDATESRLDKKKFDYISYMEEKLHLNDEADLLAQKDGEAIGVKEAKVAGERLAVYSALKKRGEQRTWGEALKHPFKTFKEWRLKNKAKDTLKKTYDLADNVIDELADYCNGTKSLDDYKGFEKGKIIKEPTKTENQKVIDNPQPIIGLEEDVEVLNTSVVSKKSVELNKSRTKTVALNKSK